MLYNLNMENEAQGEKIEQVESKSVLHSVTPLSKYLALALFIILPFIGGWIGYRYAPEKIVEIEKEVIREVEVEKVVEVPMQQITQDSSSREVYVSPNGFSASLPERVTIEEQPAQFSYSPITRVEGDFGSLCISSGYGCGGVGMQGWIPSDKFLTTSDGVEMDFNVWTRGDEVFMHLDSILKPVPQGFSEDAQIQLRTTVDQLEVGESVLTSISFTG